MRNDQLTMPPEHHAVAKRHFAFPHEVVEDPSLSLGEKRAILSEWASDACAVESFPTLRWLPGTTFPVTLSAIRDARELLDQRSLETGETRRRPPTLHRGVLADFVRKREVSRRY